ncbi:MAG: phosphoribosylformylglycinamidine synthase I [Alphaproteobacteria bacterium]
MQKKKKISIIVFPGSNCDRDLMIATEKCLGLKPKVIWHNETHIKHSNMILIPGGFSFGDYLRAGTIATKSPAIKEVIRLSGKGVPIIGICNGFQILTECGLLKGALIKNTKQLFKCENVYIKVVNNKTNFTNFFSSTEVLKMPIAHSQGNYFLNKDQIKEIRDNEQIIFKYSSKFGDVSRESNPNGSVDNIAGITNKEKNVLGLMPHPERAIDEFTSCDGIKFFENLKNLL